MSSQASTGGGAATNPPAAASNGSDSSAVGASSAAIRHLQDLTQAVASECNELSAEALHDRERSGVSEVDEAKAIKEEVRSLVQLVHKCQGENESLLIEVARLRKITEKSTQEQFALTFDEILASNAAAQSGGSIGGGVTGGSLFHQIREKARQQHLNLFQKAPLAPSASWRPANVPQLDALGTGNLQNEVERLERQVRTLTQGEVRMSTEIGELRVEQDTKDHQHESEKHKWVVERKKLAIDISELRHLTKQLESARDTAVSDANKQLNKIMKDKDEELARSATQVAKAQRDYEKAQVQIKELQVQLGKEDRLEKARLRLVADLKEQTMARERDKAEMQQVIKELTDKSEQVRSAAVTPLVPPSLSAEHLKAAVEELMADLRQARTPKKSDGSDVVMGGQKDQEHQDEHK